MAMNRPFLGICLVFALLPTLGCSNSPAEQIGAHSDNPQAVRVLPLGDSITQANNKNMSYRYWLWNMLAEKNIAVDFVGTQNSNYEGNPDFPEDFDKNHQGRWGWRSDEVLAELPEWLTHYDADVALIHLGTNDCLKNQAVPETLDELQQIVHVLRTSNSSIDIAFSTLGPTSWQEFGCLAKINQGLLQLQSKLSTTDSQIIVVSPDQEFDIASELYDGLHPNAAGEKKLAKMWLKAIEALR